MYTIDDLTKEYKQGYEDGYRHGKEDGRIETLESIEEYYDDDMR